MKVCLMCAAGRTGDSGVLGLRSIHEGFDPCGAVDEFCGGDDVLHPAVLHLGQETKSSYFCVGHASEEKHQCGSILTLLACGDTGDTNRVKFT